MPSFDLPVPVPLTQDDIRALVLTESHALRPGFTPTGQPRCRGEYFLGIAQIHTLVPDGEKRVVQPEWLSGPCCWFAFRFPGDVILAGCLYGRQVTWQVSRCLPPQPEFLGWSQTTPLGAERLILGDLFEAVHQSWTGENMPLSAYEGHSEALARRLQREAVALAEVLPAGIPTKTSLRL